MIGETTVWSNLSGMPRSGTAIHRLAGQYGTAGPAFVTRTTADVTGTAALGAALPFGSGPVSVPHHLSRSLDYHPNTGTHMGVIFSQSPETDSSGCPYGDIVYAPNVYPHLNLPPLRVPNFAGEKSTFGGWYRNFMGLVGSLDIPLFSKWDYLKRSLKGRAWNKVEGLPDSPKSYQTALDILIKVFEHDNFTSHDLIGMLTDLDSVRSDLSNLEDFTDNVRSLGHRMTSIGMTKHAMDTLTFIVFRKLPAATVKEIEERRHLGRHGMLPTIGTWKYEELVEALELVQKFRDLRREGHQPYVRVQASSPIRQIKETDVTNSFSVAFHPTIPFPGRETETEPQYRNLQGKPDASATGAASTPTTETTTCSDSMEVKDISEFIRTQIAEALKGSMPSLVEQVMAKVAASIVPPASAISTEYPIASMVGSEPSTALLHSGQSDLNFNIAGAAGSHSSEILPKLPARTPAEDKIATWHDPEVNIAVSQALETKQQAFSGALKTTNPGVMNSNPDEDKPREEIVPRNETHQPLDPKINAERHLTVFLLKELTRAAFVCAVLEFPAIKHLIRRCLIRTLDLRETTDSYLTKNQFPRTGIGTSNLEQICKGTIYCRQTHASLFPDNLYRAGECSAKC